MVPMLCDAMHVSQRARRGATHRNAPPPPAVQRWGPARIAWPCLALRVHPSSALHSRIRTHPHGLRPWFAMASARPAWGRLQTAIRRSLTSDPAAAAAAAPQPSTCALRLSLRTHCGAACGMHARLEGRWL